MLVLLDSGGLFIAFPFIEERFEAGASRTTISWVVTAFFVIMVATLLVAGRLADRFGRRRIFLTGAATYAGGAFIGAAAPTLWLLIGGRVVQAQIANGYDDGREAHLDAAGRVTLRGLPACTVTVLVNRGDDDRRQGQADIDLSVPPTVRLEIRVDG